MKYLVLIFLILALVLPCVFAQEDDSSAEAAEMTTKIKLLVDLEDGDEPAIATVTNVLVAAGDSVDEGQLLIEISVNESIQEVTSPLAATIAEVHVAQDDEVAIDQELITIEVLVESENAIDGVSEEEGATEDIATTTEEAIVDLEVAAEEVTEDVETTAEETIADLEAVKEETTEEVTEEAEEVAEDMEAATEEVAEEVTEEAEEVAEDMEAATEEVAEEVTEEAEEVAEDVEAATEEAAEGVTEETEEVVEDIEAATEEVAEEVTEEAEEVAEDAEAATEEAAEEVTEEAEEVVEDMEAATEEAAEEVTEEAEEVVENMEAATEEAAEEVAEEAEEVAEDMEAATEEAVEEVTEEAEEVAEDMEAATEEAAEEVTEEVEEVAEDVEAATEEAAEEVTEEAEEVAEDVEAATEEAAEEATEEAEEVAEDVEAATEEAVEEVTEEAEEVAEGIEAVTEGSDLGNKGSIEEIDTLKTSEDALELGVTEEAGEVVGETPDAESGGTASEPIIENLAQVAPADAILTLGFKPQTPESNSLWEDLTVLDWSGAITTLRNLGLFMSDSDFFEFLPYEAEILIEDLLDGIEEGMAASEEFEEALDEVFEFCPALAEVDWHNFSPVGEESLFTVGMNPYIPEPAITIMMLMSDDQAGTAQSIQEAFLGCAKEEMGEDMLELEEEGTTLYVLDDGGDFPVIIGRVGNAHFLSSNVDTARAIVRLANGAEEPNLASADLQQKRNEILAEKGFSFSLDLAATAEVLSAFKGAIVEDEVTEYLFDRGMAALNTIGGYASNLSISPEGLLMESMVAANPEGGDSDLAEMLLCTDCTVSVPEFAPIDTISISSSYLGLEEFLAYLQTWLDGLAPFIGEMDIKELAMTVGVDVDLLLGWLGKEFQTVTLEALSQNLSTLLYQPASAIILPVNSVEAAEEGRAAWASLWPIVKMGLELMDDEEFPSELFEYAASDTYEFQGVSIERYRFSFNVDVAIAYIDNNLIFASPPSALHTLINTANGDIDNILNNPEFSVVHESLPENASSFSFSMTSAHTSAYADLLNLFSQPLAFFLKVIIDAALEETVEYDYDFDVEEEPLLTNSYFEEDLSSVEVTSFDVGAAETISGNLAFTEESADTEDTSVAYYELTDLNVGDTVAATVSSEDFDTYLTLIATTEEGREVVLENDDFDGSYSESQVAFTVQEGVLEYVVEVTSYAGEGAGIYNLSVEAAEAPSADLEFFAAYPSEFTDEVSNSIAVGEAVEGELQASEIAVLADYFEISGVNVGDEVTVNLTSVDFDTYLYIIDATNESYVAENDDFDGSYETSQVSFTAQEGVTYLVKASSFDGSGEGAYDLTISASGAEEAIAETDIYEDDVYAEELSPENMRELAPSFIEILNLTEIIPQALLVFADHLSYSDGHTITEEDTIYSRSLIRITW